MGMKARRYALVRIITVTSLLLAVLLGLLCSLLRVKIREKSETTIHTPR
jgi:uncharacterized protein involved in exopolysaccharide biosynthesis